MIGGMYMGEIVRRVLLKMAEVTCLFGETVPESLMEPFSLSYAHTNEAVAHVFMLLVVGQRFRCWLSNSLADLKSHSNFFP